MASVSLQGQGGGTDTEKLIGTSARGQVKVSFDASHREQTTSLSLQQTGLSSPQRCVRVKVVFQKIGDIDTLKEIFIADVLVEARWREPLFDGESETRNADKIDWKRQWNPRLSVVNFLGEQKDPLSYHLEYRNNEAEVVERRRFNGTFMEQLELAEFPFDKQELQVTVASALANSDVVLEAYDCHLSKESPQSFADEQEWKLNEVVDVRISDDTQKLPSLSAFCCVSRRFGFYLWNFMFVMFMISALSLVTWAIAVTKPENRIQVTFVLLLTTITFKFAVASSLPRISYLTYLDKYILIKMVFMVTVAIWHGLALMVHVYSVGQQPTDIYWSWPDKIVFICMAFAFVTINIVFFVMIYKARVNQKTPGSESKTLSEFTFPKNGRTSGYGSCE